MPKSAKSTDLFAKVLSPLAAICEAGIPPNYLYRVLAEGQIPARKTPDGRWEISRAGLDEWLVGYGYRRRQRLTEGSRQ